ncbi:MAG: aldo/keto reductase [Hyphomicrobium sp.]|jgi:aryl-alcohol dehydrogenase-like predicted oxidoreductase|nr:aldo/keto reductase [Hyphomicrobium sp.]
MRQKHTDDFQPAGLAAASGAFRIGDDLPVYRLGFGAMRITGKGIWGEPEDRDQAMRTLRRVRELGINFIDTADSYGPEVSERLIREALYPYGGVVVATKGGLLRPGPSQWVPCGRPDYLRQQVFVSMRRLGVERIDLWQLHRIDPDVPRDEQFDAIAQMQREGLIRHVGLSEVTVGDIQAARGHFAVATVQNMFNLANRRSEAVLDYCTEHGIGFIPWFPLAAGDLARPGSVVDRLAKKYEAAPGQIALAWLLQRSPVMLPIPGTGKSDHLEQNTAAASLRLTGADLDALNVI